MWSASSPVSGPLRLSVTQRYAFGTICFLLRPKLKISILLSNCHTFLLMLLMRIWCYIEAIFPGWWFSLFSSRVCFTMYWHCLEKLDVEHWTFRGLVHPLSRRDDSLLAYSYFICHIWRGVRSHPQCTHPSPQQFYLIKLWSYRHWALEPINVVIPFESVDETQVCDHSNESYRAVFSSGVVCFWQFCKMKFQIFSLSFELSTLGEWNG